MARDRVKGKFFWHSRLSLVLRKETRALLLAYNEEQQALFDNCYVYSSSDFTHRELVSVFIEGYLEHRGIDYKSESFYVGEATSRTIKDVSIVNAFLELYTENTTYHCIGTSTPYSLQRGEYDIDSGKPEQMPPPPPPTWKPNKLRRRLKR